MHIGLGSTPISLKLRAKIAVAKWQPPCEKADTVVMRTEIYTGASVVL